MRTKYSADGSGERKKFVNDYVKRKKKSSVRFPFAVKTIARIIFSKTHLTPDSFACNFPKRFVARTAALTDFALRYTVAYLCRECPPHCADTVDVVKTRIVGGITTP